MKKQYLLLAVSLLVIAALLLTGCNNERAWESGRKTKDVTRDAEAAVEELGKGFADGAEEAGERIEQFIRGFQGRSMNKP